MTDKTLAAAIAAHASLGEFLRANGVDPATSAVHGSNGNPATDPLQADGLWVPPWLDAVNAPYKARANADGTIGAAGPDFDGDPTTTSRGVLRLATGFYSWEWTQGRADLAGPVRDNLFAGCQWAGASAFAGGIYRDEVTGVPRLTWSQGYGDATGVAPPISGIWVPTGWYTNPTELRAAYERLLAISYGPLN